MIRQTLIRSLCAGILALPALALVGCSHSSSTPNTTVGVGVVISAASTTTLTPGGSVILTAGVYNDVNNDGVTWTLSGLGSLSAQTTAQATYTAPASLSGASTATITATSRADSTQSSNITVVTAGTPLLQAQSNLPANQHNGYSTQFLVTGGISPFAWTVVAGTLPPGLEINGSTGPTMTISGTPTAVGTFTFTLQVVDGNVGVSKDTYSITVGPQASCLLSGTFSYKFHGFSKNGTPATRAGTFTVNANGDLTGYVDLKSDIGTTIRQPVLSGQCQNQIGNRGIINFQTANQNLQFDWAILNSLDEGYMQETDGSGIAGTAHFERADPAIVSAADIGSATGAPYAFGVVGTDASGERLGMVGGFTVNDTGAATGLADANGSYSFAAAPLSATFVADPGVPGRGVMHTTVAGKQLNFIYYAVNNGTSRRLFLMESDATAGTPILAGDLTPQASGLTDASFAPPGPGATPNNVSGTPAILELWNSTGVNYPTTATLLAQLYNGGLEGNSMQVSLDTAAGGANILGLACGGAFVVVPDGYGRFTMSYPAAPYANNGCPSTSFSGYLDAVSSGYVIQVSPTTGNGFGYLEAQTGFPFYQFQGGYFLGTTILPPTPSPIALLPSVSVAGGTFGGNMAGQYALNVQSGRGLAELARSLFGGSGLVFYILNDNKLVLMGNGANAINTQIGWLEYAY